jgi:hypothetical protein
MTPADSYRIRAAELMASACRCPTRAQRLELEHLALSYRRLAEQADRNSRTDVLYETPDGGSPGHPRQPHPPQQQRLR